MKMLILLFIVVTAEMLSEGAAFYKSKRFTNIPTYTPKTEQEVEHFLCMKKANGCCVDDTPATIIIDRMFDFTQSKGIKEEMGCYHKTHPSHCLQGGQLKLNVVDQCNGLTPTLVKYSVAGRHGLDVGSNKTIIGQKGGGFRGRGLRLRKSQNVEIKWLNITDINPQVIWGGDAIDLIDVKNVLIHGNYIKNVGRQMIVTHFGSNTGVSVSSNVFDGHTPYSSVCDGSHYWLWLFLGEGDRISMQNNVVLNTSGRGPHLVAAHNSTTLLHIFQNTFYDIKHTGLVDLDDTQSSILIEGNVFVNVKEIVHCNRGKIFMPQDSSDQNTCQEPLGRQCLLNTVVHSGNNKPKNSLQVLQDFKPYKNDLYRPIIMKNHITKWITIPQHVRKYIN